MAQYIVREAPSSSFVWDGQIRTVPNTASSRKPTKPKVKKQGTSNLLTAAIQEGENAVKRGQRKKPSNRSNRGATRRRNAR